MTKEASPDTLYHYCGVNAFHGIITSRTLWLSHARYMNDVDEYNWFHEKVRKYITTLPDGGESERYAILEEFVKELSSPYLFCLSSMRDLVTQWETYGQNGEGYAIGFDSQCIRNVLSFGNAAFYAHLCEVDYSESNHDLMAETFVDEFRAIPEQDLSTLDAALSAIHLSVFAKQYKNPAYKQEAEWRIVLTPGTSSLVSSPAVYDVGPSPLLFREANGQKIPYFALRFPVEAVSEIWLGPKNSARSERGALECFMRKNDYHNIRIVDSQATYR